MRVEARSHKWYPINRGKHIRPCTDLENSFLIAVSNRMESSCISVTLKSDVIASQISGENT